MSCENERSESKPLTWDEMFQHYKVGSRYLVVYSSNNPSIIGKEGIIVESGNNFSFVKIRVDNKDYMIHFSNLRDVFSDEFRTRLKAQPRRPVSSFKDRFANIKSPYKN